MIEPAFVRLPPRLDQQIEAATRLFLDSLNDLANEAAEAFEEGLTPSPDRNAPPFTVAQYRAYLTATVTLPRTAQNSERQHAEALINSAAAALEELHASLRCAIDSVVRGDGAMSSEILWVNDPLIRPALERFRVPLGEVILVSFPEYLPPQPPDMDQRRDVLVGATLWHGFYICKAALVDLSVVGERLQSLDETVAEVKHENVYYTPRYGVH
jgi:hypothetical protein